MKPSITLFWHRRDLRLDDNAGLYNALKANTNVQPIFIFDREILDQLQDKDDARVSFIHQYVTQIANEYNQLGSSLWVFYGTPTEVLKQLTQDYNITNVYTNRDYEPYATKRDGELANYFKSKGIGFYTFKDQVIFEQDEVVKDDGKPYTVFSPYGRKWRAKLNAYYLKSYNTDEYFHNLHKTTQQPAIPSLADMGFVPTSIQFPLRVVDEKIVRVYDKMRNFPAVLGTTRLSVHLRFGTVSIRQLATYAQHTNDVWLNELIWREFYMMILWHFPQVVTKAFKPVYDNIEWTNNADHFERWCNGKTGYPIVDAGMRELNATGFMHNRVRMIVASFLCKHLLIDWRWGEAYFARKLLDFELASNNGGWQWASSSGCDAAPYFRIFNPALQTDKFDAKLEYIKRWVPEYQDRFTYPQPIVEHTFARNRALEAYKKAVGAGS